jgi:hypothetical protein
LVQGYPQYLNGNRRKHRWGIRFGARSHEERDRAAPHVHTLEHEFFYVLEGNLDAFVDDDVFHVGPGECVFLPVGRPHAFLIRSPEIRLLTLITPGGFMKAVAPMAAPAEKMEIPTDMVTYATADLQETMKFFLKHGLRLLSADEIAREMPAYRQPVAA